MRVISTFTIVFFVLGTVTGYGQPDTLFSKNMRSAEDSLKFYLNTMRSQQKDEDKLVWNLKFKKCLEKTLKNEEAFTYPFDSLFSIGKLTSPDNAFRIFNWNVEKNDFTQSYFAFVMVPGNRRNKLFELRDMSPGMTDPQGLQTDHRRWFGCLYYDIVVSRDKGKTEYTLLGYDMNDRSSKKRVIEGMSIQQDKLVFGLAIFEYKEDDEKTAKTYKRLVFEYSSEVQMAMKYHPKEKRIVFDHLSPNDQRADGLREFYFPDGSYDAIELQEDGTWKFLSDVDVRGTRTKIYNDPRKH